MIRYLHIFLITCLLGLGLAEAAERVLPEVTVLTDGGSIEHEHHSGSAEHDSESDAEHCADCCHAPCFWLASDISNVAPANESIVIRGPATPRYTSERPPQLFRPPIA